jgi:acetoin utilization deacetylase AcuC-like enzyme
MKAVFNAVQLGHHPTRFLSYGNIVDYPDQPERARVLLTGARKAGAQVRASRSFEDAHLTAVHIPRYLKFLEQAHSQWSHHKGAFGEVMPSLRPVEPLARYPKHVLGRAGWHLMDFSCPILEDTWRVVKASAMTALTAAQLVSGGERAVYALTRPPGHHAYAERASGFCYLNNAAIAAQYLRATNPKVAILDLDVHHGNGTQSIFYARDDVLTVSIHANPHRFYPFYWGHEEERGRGPGTGFNINIPVPLRSDDEVWLGALHYALEQISAFAPPVLVLALGLDAHEADPLRGGRMTTAGFERVGARVGALNIPTVIIQEGGYLTEQLGGNLASFLGGFQSGGRKRPA